MNYGDASNNTILMRSLVMAKLYIRTDTRPKQLLHTNTIALHPQTTLSYNTKSPLHPVSLIFLELHSERRRLRDHRRKRLYSITDCGLSHGILLESMSR